MLVSAAEATLPNTCYRNDSGRIAGWSEHVQPLRKKALFWHKMWLDCERPRDGAVADSMRRTRATYHYAIRNVKRNEDSIISEKVAQAMLKNNARDFWSEVERIRSHRSGSSRTVDSQTDPSSIAGVFAKNYRELYSSVPYDFNKMQRTNEDINCLLSSEQMSSDYIYSCNDVKDAVSHLKAHKNDGH